jgi:hypothetical protein
MIRQQQDKFYQLLIENYPKPLSLHGWERPRGKLDHQD